MDDAPALGVALGVVELLSDQWDAIDADFARFYGLDLAAACFGPDHVGVARLHSLIAHLPADSALARAMGWSWDEGREMTATLIELVHDQTVSGRAMVQALSGKRFTGPKKPLRWPRPQLPTPSTPGAEQGAVPLDRHAIRAMFSQMPQRLPQGR